MAYKDWFQWGSTEEKRLYIYATKPSKVTSLSDLEWHLSDTGRYVSELKALLADFAEYQAALVARYNELESMMYKTRVKLERRPNNGYGVKYYLSVTKVYEDGTEDTDLKQSKTYAGKERREAMKAFEALRKPGVEMVLDIEKKRWER